MTIWTGGYAVAVGPTRYDRVMRFDQVKIFVRDAKGLASFYQNALGCRLLSPVTDFADEALAHGFGAPGSRVRLAFLGLPGMEEGPILELYQFPGEGPSEWPYQPGQGHLAFQVDDVGEAAERLVEEGGDYLGEVATWRAPSGNLATFVFMLDPEGNLIDLWARRESG